MRIFGVHHLPLAQDVVQDAFCRALELRRGDRSAARGHFQAALALARNDAERRFLEKRIQACADA